METISLSELVADLRSLGISRGFTPALPDATRVPAEMLDRWARGTALGEPTVRQAATWAIREAARAAGLVPVSIHGLYAARGRGVWGGRTVPALNLRGWSYQTCRAAFRAAAKLDADLLIFEQAPTEMVFADQRPAEYAAAVLAAAMREGHRGPIFLQGDHVQVNPGAYTRDPAAEIGRLSELIREEIAAGFFNIDVDASTVVDLSLPTLVDQQRLNAELTAQFLYTTRKKAWASLKARFWDLPAEIQEAIGASLEEMFREMFERLNVGSTKQLVARLAQAPVIGVPAPAGLAKALEG